MTQTGRRPGRRGSLAAVAAACLGMLLGACGPGPAASTASSSAPSPSTPSPSTSATTSTPAGPSATTPSPVPAATLSPSSAPSSAPSPSADASTGPLAMTATRSTLFDTARAFRLEVDGGSEAVAVTSLRLDSSLFEPVEAVARDVVVGPGGHVLVPLPYGPSDCRADAGGGLGEVVVGTTSGRLRVPLDEYPGDLVTGLHRRECAVAAVRAAVDPRFADFTRTAPRVATGQLLLSPPADGEPVELLGIEGNILFGATTEATLPQTVATAPVVIPVRMAANRCDTHALIEAKKKFHVPVTVAIGDGQPLVVEVEATGATRRLFQHLLEACLEDPG